VQRSWKNANRASASASRDVVAFIRSYLLSAPVLSPPGNPDGLQNGFSFAKVGRSIPD